MLTVPAYAAASAGSPLARTEIVRRDLRDNDVLIEIAYVGVCHSDVHQGRQEWGDAIFPMVPGHEIAGIVAGVGPRVTRWSVGDRVGVGCFVDSCRSCDNCATGHNQYCLKGETATYNALDYGGEPTYGGYSSHIVVDEGYVLAIPDSIPLDRAAPLLCAGISLYSPLRHWRVGPGTSVAIMGLGGLGHMGVKLAHAMGADVTVLSRSLAKERDSLRFGATRHLSTADPGTLASLRGEFDLVISTISAQVPLDPYLELLRLDGTLVLVGLPAEAQQSFTAFPLGAMRRTIAASKNGSIRQTQEMLEFCATHRIAPEIEVVDFGAVNQAWDRLTDGDVRYRFVLDVSTISA